MLIILTLFLVTELKQLGKVTLKLENSLILALIYTRELSWQ